MNMYMAPEHSELEQKLFDQYKVPEDKRNHFNEEYYDILQEHPFLEVL